MGFDLDTLLRALGRAHPIAVHFPIALLLAAAIFEFFALLRRRTSPTALACLALGAASAVPAATVGWFNAEFEKHGSSTADILFWHRWLGIGLAAIAILALVAGLLSRKRPKAVGAYRLMLIAIAPAVVWVGHLGGTMVYGEGYLLEPFREARAAREASEQSRHEVENSPAPPEAENSAPVAADPGSNDEPLEPPPQSEPVVEFVDFNHVLPIFEARCVECHGSRKQKGKLRLDSAEAVLSRVDAGVVVPGDPETSSLVVRIELDAAEDDAMPPEGDRLSTDEIALIRAWIAQGARASTSASEPTTPAKQPTAGALNEGAASATTAIQMAPAEPQPEELAPPARELTEAELAVMRAIEARGGLVVRVAARLPEVEVNFALVPSEKGPIGDADLALLGGLEACLVGLNLGGTAITDAGAAGLSDFPQLRRLWLDRTVIGDDAMASVASLANLEYLNVYATAVGDLGLARLHGMKRLRNVYVWRSKATRRGVADLYESLTGVRIEMGE